MESLVVAYVGGEEDKWKFLCKKANNKLKIIYDYNGESFIGLELENFLYIVRDATKKDIDDAILKSI